MRLNHSWQSINNSALKPAVQNLIKTTPHQPLMLLLHNSKSDNLQLDRKAMRILSWGPEWTQCGEAIWSRVWSRNGQMRSTWSMNEANKHKLLWACTHPRTHGTARHCLPLNPSSHHHPQRMWAIREGPSITRPVNYISYDVMQWGSHCTLCADAPENERSEAKHTCTPAGLLYAHLEVLIKKLVFILIELK